jgi:3,4-dihydroxy 2-butanone 4-phosphate synthase/GTP cyclohydrolase II
MTDKDKSVDRALANVHLAIDAIKKGGMVLLTDDESRENEGDLVFAAEDVTAEKINFMAKEARGLVCLALSNDIVDRLKLPMMVDHSKLHTPMGTAFTVSIEARTGVSTGISAADRAHTVRVAIDDHSGPEQLVVPGHVFPLRAKDGGVLERTGHTEGSVDLARLAGKKSAAVICEVMRDDGAMARQEDLVKFAEKFSLPLLRIEDLITYRLLKDTLITEVKRAPFKSSYGTFSAVWFQCRLDRSIHLALVKGEQFADKCVDVRVHRQSPLVDVFSSFDTVGDTHKDGRWKIDYALKMLAEKESGIFVYLKNSDPDAFLNAHSQGFMDPRHLGIGAQILKYFGVARMRLHVSSLRPLVGLSGFGLEIIETQAMTI